MNYRTMRPELAKSIGGPVTQEPEFLELEELFGRRPIDSARSDVLRAALLKKGFTDRDVDKAFTSGPYQASTD